jgi:hypothetical protein
MIRVSHPLPPTTQPLAGHPLPRVTLVTDAQIVDGPAASLAAVQDADFDPRKHVILESKPDPVPATTHGNPGEVWIVGRKADSLTIDAEVAHPAILLITDAYSAGWHAEPPYRVVPANHALRGIALTAGRHHIVMQYRPAGVRMGVIISALAVIATVALPVVAAITRRRGQSV